MNTTALARIINERRYRGNPVLTTGEILSTMGPEGMQEALSKQWLVPDSETGFLMVNTHGGKMAEVEEACKCRLCQKPQCNCESQDDNTPASTFMASGMREAWAGAGIGRGSDGLTGGNPTPPRPQPISPTTPPQNSRFGVTDPVMVTDDDGSPVLGAVSDVGQDGRYKLKFQDKKPRMDRFYNPSEMRPVDGQPNA